MWPNPQFPADLITVTEKTLNENPHFLCSGIYHWLCITKWTEKLWSLTYTVQFSDQSIMVILHDFSPEMNDLPEKKISSKVGSKFFQRSWKLKLILIIQRNLNER